MHFWFRSFFLCVVTNHFIHKRQDFNGCHTVMNRRELLPLSLPLLVIADEESTVPQRTSERFAPQAISFVMRYTVSRVIENPLLSRHIAL